MSATTDHVGVRVFSDLQAQLATILTDQTHIGMCMPCPLADNSIEKDRPYRIRTDDADTIALLGDGLAKDAFTQIASEGITADIIFVRADDDLDADTQTGLIAGSAVDSTGMWAMTHAGSELKIEPDFLLSPGFTHTRPGGAANPIVVAMDGVCTRQIDCMGIMDTPETSVEDALEAAADFATSLNIVAMYPQALVTLDAQNVTRPLSPHVAAAHLRRDKEVGGPWKAAWNRPLRGIRGISQLVGYTDGDETSESNHLNFNGVGTVIENKLLWAPFSTATDPTVIGYRSIKRIRVRRQVEKAILRPLRLYNSEDLDPHTVTLIYKTLDDFLDELSSPKIGAIIDHKLIFKAENQSDSALKLGKLAVDLKFEETPDLVDLQIYSEPLPSAFDVLIGRIGFALESLGDPNIVVEV